MYGYTTNEDGTETLAWHIDNRGVAVCIHDDERACDRCREADERIAARVDAIAACRFCTIGEQGPLLCSQHRKAV